MVDVIRKDDDSIADTDIQSVLRRKFLRIKLGKREYCFRILHVLEILDGKNCILEVRPGFKDYENLYGRMHYDDGVIPVFDLGEYFSHGEQAANEKCYVIIMDVISNGFILQLGVMVHDVQDIMHAVMSEIGDTIAFGRI